MCIQLDSQTGILYANQTPPYAVLMQLMPLNPILMSDGSSKTSKIVPEILGSFVSARHNI